jgi:hypothetical protein
MRPHRSTARIVALLCALSASSLGLASSALASTERAGAFPEDRAAAQAAVIQKADLGEGWAGGLTTIDLQAANQLASVACPDLASARGPRPHVNAVAASHYSRGTTIFLSVAVVFRQASMATTDVATLAKPNMAACVRNLFTTALGSSSKVGSLDPLPFPNVAAQTVGYRMHVTLLAPMAFDIVAFRKGRTEIQLMTFVPADHTDDVRGLEVRVARAIAARMRV